jgi:hypothetical protein
MVILSCVYYTYIHYWYLDMKQINCSHYLVASPLYYLTFQIACLFFVLQKYVSNYVVYYLILL